MIEFLRDCYNQQKIVSFYNDQDDSCKHFTGYIGAMNEDEVLIHHISIHGLYDGYIVIPICTIYQLDCDGKYEKKIERLYHIKKQIHEKIKIKDGIFFSVLAFAQRKKYVLYIELQDTTLTGIIKNYNNETLFLEKITEFGELDGVCKVNIDEINLLSVDTDDEQDLLLLLNTKE